MTLTAYDPTEFNFNLFLDLVGEVPVYGFVKGDKITFDKEGLIFHVQSTSGCVDKLLDYLGSVVSVRLTTENDKFKKLLNLFDGLYGELILEKGCLISSNIPVLSFKIKWVV